MKRSEMVRIISDWITNNVKQYYRNGITFYEHDASMLLSKLENSGMLPPGYMKPIKFESDGKQYPLIPGDFPDEKGIWCTPGVNEWENE